MFISRSPFQAEYYWLNVSDDGVDVPWSWPGHWPKPLSESGETLGTGMGVTRQDMAVMILRVLKAEEAAGASGFTDDSEISDYAKPAVTALKKLGVISGTNEGKFNPKAVMIRAEAAVVINNIINLAR